MTIWLNGQLTENGALDATGAGATLGWGVFTTIGVRGGVPLFLGRHFERLARDAREADIPFEFSQDEIERGLDATLRSNSIENGLARLTLTKRGDGRWNPLGGADLSIMALEIAATNIMRVQLSPYRVEARRPLVGVKTTSYLPYQWAWREAKAAGFDEAILRDGKDFLSEGARSSLLWFKDGKLFLPSLETGCLRGIGRDLVLEWAQENHVPIHQGQFSNLEALNADETCLVSAATGPRFISSWHDEDGILLRHWEAVGNLGLELKSWWGE